MAQHGRELPVIAAFYRNCPVADARCDAKLVLGHLKRSPRRQGHPPQAPRQGIAAAQGPSCVRMVCISGTMRLTYGYM